MFTALVYIILRLFGVENPGSKAVHIWSYTAIALVLLIALWSVVAQAGG